MANSRWQATQPAMWAAMRADSAAESAPSRQAAMVVGGRASGHETLAVVIGSPPAYLACNARGKLSRARESVIAAAPLEAPSASAISGIERP